MLRGGGFALIAILMAAPAPAADFYAGKTIDFIIGGDVGGGYDIYARIVARHLSRFIAGNPTIVPKNQPGAGSGRAASSLYSVAPKDGSAIGAVFPGAIMGPLLDDRAQPLYDPTKFQYLASADNATRVCISTSIPRSALRGRAPAEIHHGRERRRQLDARPHQHAQEGDRREFDLVAGKGTADIFPGARRGRRLCGPTGAPEVAAAGLGQQQTVSISPRSTLSRKSS
jgi:hypothetical protein